MLPLSMEEVGTWNTSSSSLQGSFGKTEIETSQARCEQIPRAILVENRKRWMVDMTG